MDTTNNTLKSFSYLGGLVALGMVLSALIFSISFYASRDNNSSLSVTGSAKKEVEADRVRWSLSLTRTVDESQINAGYQSLAKDLAAVKQLYTQSGVAEDEYTVSPVYMDQVYKQNDYANREYSLRQIVEINSPKVAEVSALAKNVQVLASQGVLFQSMPLEYTYSKLAEARVELLADAMRDAKERARQIANSGGSDVGDLQSAASGVVQVLSPGSISVDDYGAYDTQSLKKEIMVTVRASFTLE
jgi:hypothetical protein